jgi:GTPase SAR1 family protein
MEGWFQDVRQQRGEEALVVFIGNKTDLADQRQVSAETAMAKAKSLGVIYIEVSARTGDNISELFRNIATRLPTGDMSQFITSQQNQNCTIFI